MTDKKAPRGAELQFEIERERWFDTLYRGGTFVLVVTEKKVTMIQRPDAEEFPE